MKTPPTKSPLAPPLGNVRRARTFLTDLPRSAKRLIMIVFDVILLTGAFLTALSVRFAETRFALNDVAVMLVLGPLVTVPIFVKFGLYRAVIRYLELRMALTVLTSVTVASLVLYATLNLLGLTAFSGGDALAYWMITLLYMGASRILAREFFRQRVSKDTERVIIYGAGEAGAQLAVSLQNNPRLRVIALVDDNPDVAGSVLYGVRVHRASQLPWLVLQFRVQQVLVAIPSASKEQRKRIFERIEPLGVRMRTIPNLARLIEGRAKISDIQDVGIDELLGRDPVPPVPELLSRCIRGKTVLVTGAGGSIGSELCRQILANGPKRLILFEQSEYALYSIKEELASLKQAHSYATELVDIIGSVTRKELVRTVLVQHGVNTVYHAAAYKHVPIVEINPLEGIRNNVIGTWRTAVAALEANVDSFVLVSTDKAVRPTNIMGASKRFAELVMQAIGENSPTQFCMVRFGNVLDSSGSVVPLFRKQIQSGGPVLVTHPDITRYFMTIPEAAQLVLQAGAMARGGDVFVLDMGEPVRIRDLARTMIHLSGHSVQDEANPSGNIQIRYIGLRPGEKLHEELLIGQEATGTEHPRIMRAMEEAIPWTKLEPLLSALEQACAQLDTSRAVSILCSAVPVTGRSVQGEPTQPKPAVRGSALHVIGKR